MKKIILDQIWRWRVAMILIGAVYFLFAGFFEREGGSETLANPFNALLNHTIYYVCTFQIIIIYLGFFLTMDLQRGLTRVLSTLPVTTKQIGRALWLASVAIPAAGLAVIGFISLLVFSVGTTKAMPFGSYLVACILAVPTLGAMFGATTFTTTAIPETFLGRIRAMFSNVFLMLPIFGLFFFDKTNPNLIVAVLIFAALTFLTIIGWFRAGQLVSNRAGFRIVKAKALEVAAIFFIPMDTVSVCIPLVLWWGLERNAVALVGFVFFVSMALPILFGLDSVPLSLRCAVTIILVSISFIATKYLLPRSSKAYRLQLSSLGAWGMGRR